MTSSTLAVTLDEDFLSLYPDASIHVLLAEGVNVVEDDLAEEWKARAQDSVAGWGVDPQRLVEQPWIAEWRSVMKRMGVNAAKIRSSIEQLSKRALGGSYITTRIPAVNLYCHISLICQVPMGGYDISNVRGAIRVRLGRHGDSFLGIGEKQSILVPPGTVIYADDEHVACFAWNHRDSAHTCLRRETQSAIFFADASTDAGRRRAEGAITLLAEVLSNAGARISSRGVLDSQCPSETFLTILRHLDQDRPSI